MHSQRTGGRVSDGFPEAEYAARLTRAQQGMAQLGAGALLLTTEADIRYFTGFLTRFWESPSRSWFLVVPAQGKPVAIIPSIGAALMASTWVEDIRTWPAPRPEDDGVSLLVDALQEVGGPVALPMGYETHLRMPLADFDRVRARVEIVPDQCLMADLRAIKSPVEIARISKTCALAGRAFDRMGEIARPGAALSEVFRAFQRLLLEEGADFVPYLAGGAGPFGYRDVISPAADTPLQHGDVVMLDTGAVRDGYFCDFDRNFAVGAASSEVRDAHKRLIDATAAGLEAARPGALACEVWKAMAKIVGPDDAPEDGAGRMGHGLGMQLTEGLSLTPLDRTVLQPGMVITLEPYVETRDGCLMVHEENIAITADGAIPLTRFSGRDIPILP
ncbi:MAG: Xaa-Pro peptidase family protein [Pseudomonadota bacterium]